jgi:hypothetical protein
MNDTNQILINKKIFSQFKLPRYIIKNQYLPKNCEAEKETPASL